MAGFTKEQLIERVRHHKATSELFAEDAVKSMTAKMDVRIFEIALAALTAGMGQEPVVWPNHCDSTIPAALRFLAEKPRPIYGNSPYNTEHLYQLAREIEAMTRRPLYAAPQLPQPAVAITQHFDTIALDTAKMVMCDVNRRDEFLGGDIQLLSRIQCRIDEACRAAMLRGAEPVRQPLAFFDGDISPEDAEKIISHLREMNRRPGSQQVMIAEPVQSYTLREGWVAVPIEPTAEMISEGIAAHYERSQVQIHDRPAPGPMECAYRTMVKIAQRGEAE
ncbi:hypothetical protein NLO40_08710 [Escherichia coli]|nr:hypothetical protein [Escherichia coli]